jgi:two-component system chemotaxis response regulator CheB
MAIKVLVVDDSAVMRRILIRLLSAQPDIEVVGGATDPYDAREKIKALNPDVLTLDVQMPKMDGLKFLENLMRLRPMPVIMLSAYTQEGADVTIKALELGAVDFMPKPELGPGISADDFAAELAEKIRTAARARVRGRAVRTPASSPPLRLTQSYRPTQLLIAMAASTGGTEAIAEVLSVFPANMPPVVIVQHMPAGFTNSFAARLDHLSAMTVTEGKDGDLLEVGHAYIAPGGHQMRVTGRKGRYNLKITDEPPYEHHRPSADLLFLSVAEVACPDAFGVIMTGMGKDGAKGLLAMKEKGSYNFAQDEETCVVFGMPKEAIAVGAIDEILPIQKLGERVVQRVEQYLSKKA